MLLSLSLFLPFKVNVTLPVWFSAFSLRHSEIKTVIPLETRRRLSSLSPTSHTDKKQRSEVKCWTVR